MAMNQKSLLLQLSEPCVRSDRAALLGNTLPINSAHMTDAAAKRLPRTLLHALSICFVDASNT